MTRLAGDDPRGATPLEAEDLDALIPTFVATRGDLNLVEQVNIEKATRWAFRNRSRRAVDDVLSVTFVLEVHAQMFGDVWKWAGKQRRRVTNIGVEPVQIVTQTKALLDDAAYWHAHDTYEATERAVRLHHRMVAIHPFPNGNGRHSRFVADLYLHEIGQPRLPWGEREDLGEDGKGRARYIAALQEADRGDIGALLAFATS